MSSALVVFSGGQDSTAMLVRMLELKMPLDYAVFCDTGAEFDAMYCYLDFLDKWLQDNYNFKITRLSANKTYEDIVKQVMTDRAKEERIGRPKGITQVLGMDYCTRDLKVNVINKFCKQFDKVTHYNGYTYNEVLKNRGNAQEKMLDGFSYPLYNWKWNEPQIAGYLKEKCLFNPLYNHFTRTGCFLCPKQSIKSWFMLWKNYNHHYEYAKTLEKWCDENDAVSKRFIYRKIAKIDRYEWVSLFDLEKEFKTKDNQKTFDFEDDMGDVSCHCK